MRVAASLAMVFGSGWHTDSPFLPQPPAITTLRSVEVPPFGGDTIWANAARAYEELSPPLRDLCDGIICFGGEDWWYHNRGHYDIQMMRELSARRDFRLAPHVRLGVGALYAFNFVPAPLEALYAGDPNGAMLFVRLRID